MSIERARVRAVQKPWGTQDLRPWSTLGLDTGSIGELWYERNQNNAQNPSLLFKILATTEPLSIQVHPGDEFARTIGLPSGKTEAWYVLSAKPDSKVAVGLTQRISKDQLRQAIREGSIAQLVQWNPVVAGDVIFVPAGTIHAIGAGLVVAEIQQRSDATFRIFDYGRPRELHIEHAVSVANAGPADFSDGPTCYTTARTILVVDRHFVLERVELSPNSTWNLSAGPELWFFVAEGKAQLGPLEISIADVVFAELEQISIKVGSSGLKALVAYPGPAVSSGLLTELPDADANRH